MDKETTKYQTEKGCENTEFGTAFQSIDSEKRTAKEAGLSQEEAIDFEARECSKALCTALLTNEEVSDAERFGIIREHLYLLLPAVESTAAMYA